MNNIFRIAKIRIFTFTTVQNNIFRSPESFLARVWGCPPISIPPRMGDKGD
jgi:hypothetical protein